MWNIRGPKGLICYAPLISGDRYGTETLTHARFIAAAPDLVRRLIAEVERLRAREE
jgi:hypothetical protein